MRAVVQRVERAEVTVADAVVGRIGTGVLVYLGVGVGDDEAAGRYVAEKIVNLRIFSDETGKMNRSVLEVGGAVLVVSQFTLYGDVRRGRRPAFDGAMEPVGAERLYEFVVGQIRALGVPVQTGMFRADMRVDSAVDGPVTLLVESRPT